MVRPFYIKNTLYTDKNGVLKLQCAMGGIGNVSYYMCNGVNITDKVKPYKVQKPFNNETRYISINTENIIALGKTNVENELKKMGLA